MRLKFWKKNRPLDLDADVERRLHDGQIANLAKWGRFVRVEYYPFNVRDDEAWAITFDVTLADKTGLHYGHKGVRIVNEVGLPGFFGKNVRLVAEDNGRAVVKSLNCLNPYEIAELAQEVEDAVTEILDEYRRFEVMGRVRKGVKQ